MWFVGEGNFLLVSGCPVSYCRANYCLFFRCTIVVTYRCYNISSALEPDTPQHSLNCCFEHTFDSSLLYLGSKLLHCSKMIRPNILPQPTFPFSSRTRKPLQFSSCLFSTVSFCLTRNPFTREQFINSAALEMFYPRSKTCHHTILYAW